MFILIDNILFLFFDIPFILIELPPLPAAPLPAAPLPAAPLPAAPSLDFNKPSSINFFLTPSITSLTLSRGSVNKSLKAFLWFIKGSSFFFSLSVRFFNESSHLLINSLIKSCEFITRSNKDISPVCWSFINIDKSAFLIISKL